MRSCRMHHRRHVALLVLLGSALMIGTARAQAPMQHESEGTPTPPQFHHDGGDPAKGLDITATLREYLPGTHLYYCGPAGMMAAAEAASRHWPPGTAHCEYFAGPKAVRPMNPD